MRLTGANYSTLDGVFRPHSHASLYFNLNLEYATQAVIIFAQKWTACELDRSP